MLLAACGSSTAQKSPSPTPLPPPVLQQRYLEASDAYAAAVAPVISAATQSCDPGAAGAGLARCAAALSVDRQAAVAFDDAVRALRFASPARLSVDQLLGDDARLEMLLLQASTAPSLGAASVLTPAIFDQQTKTAHDAAAVRAAIGLPPATPAPVAS